MFAGINSYIEQINNRLLPDQHLTEPDMKMIVAIINNVHLLDSDNNLPLLLDKKVTGLTHALLVTKSGDRFSILVKPALKNTLEKHENKQSGTFKIVKTSGVKIDLDRSGNLTAINRAVTVSKQNRTEKKNEELKRLAVYNKSSEESDTPLTNGEHPASLAANLRRDGFSEINFKDSGKNTERTIFTKKYLGEPLLTFLLKEGTGYHSRLDIARQLIEKFNWQMSDIKLANILISDTGEVNYIDFRDVLFTYTTKNDGTRDKSMRGVYDLTDQVDRQAIPYQQIFGLCCVLYQIFNPRDLLKGCWHNVEDIEKTRLSIRNESSDVAKKKFEKVLVINNEVPFASLVIDAFHERKNPEAILNEIRLELELRRAAS